jgi:hypothetical protein
VPAYSAATPTGPGLVRGRWEDSFAYLPQDVREYAITGWCQEHLVPRARCVPN